MIRADRKIKRGGGLAIISREEIKVKGSSTGSLPDCELSFQITLNNNYTLTGLLVYRPPKAHSSLLENISPFLEASINFSDYTVLGDFNYHLEKDEDNKTMAFVEAMASFSLEQIVRQDTRRRAYSRWDFYF